MLLLCLIIWSFFSMFAFPSFAFRQIYALAGVVIFSLYVLYDTHQSEQTLPSPRPARARAARPPPRPTRLAPLAVTQRLAYDEYVLGAIELYLDFINLFLFILQLLTGGQQE